MKILVLMNAHALAHVSRPLEIARILRKRGYEFIFAGFGKYLKVAEQAGFETRELSYISAEQLVKAVRAQRLDQLYKADQLKEFIERELELYKEIKPDLLITDCRMTASTSAELAKIKTVAILNIHMSMYRKIPFYSLRNFLRLNETNFKENWMVNITDRIENKIEFYFYDKLVMGNINKLRVSYGLEKKYSYMMEEGDLTLFPDIPEFIPVSRMPDNAYYVGPLTWHNDLPAPACLRENKIDPSKKCIYLTIGSDGLEELIEEISVLVNKSIQVIIAKGGAKQDTNMPLPSGVFVEEFVNTDKLYGTEPGSNRIIDLIVCHGGNGTIYQALNAGIPIVGIATHEEQNYGLKRVNRLELGIGLTAKTFKQKGVKVLLDAIEEVINNPKYKRNAERFQQLILKNGNSAEKAADIVENYCNMIR